MAQQMASKSVASILEQSSGALAAYAAAEIEQGDAGHDLGAFGRWRPLLSQFTIDLAAAMRAEEPALVAGRVRWHLDAFAARQIAPEAFLGALQALQVVLLEQVPETAHPTVDVYFKAGFDAFEGTISSDASALEIETPESLLAREYLDAVLSGDRRAARKMITEAAGGAIAIRSIYTNVLIPVMNEVGRLWHIGQLSVSSEHLVTNTTRSVMGILCQQATPAPPNGLTVLCAAVAGEEHDLGIEAACDILELEGWRSIGLGANVPSEDLALAVAEFEAHVVVLSATLSTSIRALESTVNAVRRASSEAGFECTIIVGGLAVVHAGEYWQRIGADALARTISELPELALALAS